MKRPDEKDEKDEKERRCEERFSCVQQPDLQGTCNASNNTKNKQFLAEITPPSFYSCDDDDEFRFRKFLGSLQCHRCSVLSSSLWLTLSFFTELHEAITRAKRGTPKPRSQPSQQPQPSALFNCSFSKILVITQIESPHSPHGPSPSQIAEATYSRYDTFENHAMTSLNSCPELASNASAF